LRSFARFRERERERGGEKERKRERKRELREKFSKDITWNGIYFISLNASDIQEYRPVRLSRRLCSQYLINARRNGSKKKKKDETGHRNAER